MPVKVGKRKGPRPYKIVETKTGKVKGSSKTKKKASASMRMRNMASKMKTLILLGSFFLLTGAQAMDMQPGANQSYEVVLSLPQVRVTGNAKAYGIAYAQIDGSTTFGVAVDINWNNTDLFATVEGPTPANGVIVLNGGVTITDDLGEQTFECPQVGYQEPFPFTFYLECVKK